jgi:F420H2 dehydrogenase subunit N
MEGNFAVILPVAILMGGAFAIYVVTRTFHLSNKIEAMLAILVLIGALAALLNLVQPLNNLPDIDELFYGIRQPGGILFYPNIIGVYIGVIACFICLFICAYSGEYLSRDPRYLLYYPLILLTIAGLLSMFFSVDLFNLFLMAELTTITGSALIAFRFTKEEAVKAGFKYLVMSSLGTMTMMLGIYFIYRGTGSLNLLETSSLANVFTRTGAACFLVGFSIKAGVVPLHTWVPDVYHHAPSAVSGLFAGITSKSMLFIIPLITLRLGMTAQELGLYLMVFASFNMLVGVFRMLTQQQIRRFLSYSSLAQTGYLMFTLGIGFYYQLPSAYAAGLYLLSIIAFMKCLAFLTAGNYEYRFGTGDINQLMGANRLAPLNAFAFSTALAGLSGIPLLAGFTGKWLIFTAALTAGDAFAIAGLVVFLVCTVIGSIGYLPMLVKQYQKSRASLKSLEKNQLTVSSTLWIGVPVVILTLIVIVTGLFPTPWINLIENVVSLMAVV